MNVSHAFCSILTSSEKSQKLKAIIYLNFAVLLQKNKDLISDMEYKAVISIYHTMAWRTPKSALKTLFELFASSGVFCLRSPATEEFSWNNYNLFQQSLDTILAVIHLGYKEIILGKSV